MSEPIINKVAESGLITINLEDFLPAEEIVAFDLQPLLFMGMILKEKDFRAALTNISWDQYKDKNVAIYCSADAVIPVWAYMLVASNLQPFAKDIVMGNPERTQAQLLLKNIDMMDTTPYSDQRIVVKGCGEIPIGEDAYMEITKKLRPLVKSIMYGEPCSTVPVYKKKA